MNKKQLKNNHSLITKIQELRQKNYTIADIHAAHPEYSLVTYKRFFKGSGRVAPDKNKQSLALKNSWANITEDKKDKRIEHLRNLAMSQKDKPLVHSESWRQNNLAWMKSEANRNRVSEQNKRTKLKYSREKVDEICRQNQAQILSVNNRTITIQRTSGGQITVPIQSLFIKEFPWNPQSHGLYNQNKLQQRLLKIGITVNEHLEKGLAQFTYKNYSWTGKWKGFISPTLKKSMQKIDHGNAMQDLLNKGKSINHACGIYGYNSTTVYKRMKRHGDLITAIRSIHSTAKMLEVPEAIYNNKLPGTSFRPDIRIEGEHKLIIETDGVYWHTEDRVGRSYHARRARLYADLGYPLLVFNEHELDHKKPIVDSMIANKLKKISNKIHARKCRLVEMTTEQASRFFEENHLMGKGQGKGIGLAIDGEIVCGIRYVIRSEEIHVSRFCNKVFTSVVGGYSRLLSKLPPNKTIVNFVDRRHGDGKHLINLGFIQESTHIGMWWSDNYRLFNRRKFPGNSGYEQGMKKYHDYGQIKYVKRPG